MMTNKEAVNWIINITADIGKAEHRDLWHYEQALYEIREMLEYAQPKINNQINLCDTCRHTYPDCPAGEDDVLFGNGEGGDIICACGKYEVQGKQEIELDCDTCKHSEKQWDEPPCDECCRWHSRYEPKEPTK